MTAAATTPHVSEPDTRVAERFAELAAVWRAETHFLSSSTAMVGHPAYREIVGLGPAVVPLLLADLRRQPDHWFAALKEITGEDPVPPGHRGRIGAMADDWFGWGRARGLS